MIKLKMYYTVLFFMAIIVKAQAYQIGTTVITYSDPARSNRSIQTEIYYPAGTAGSNVAVSSGTFPVIVFGHGFMMAWSAYQNIWEDLVPQGYIVAFPTTEGSISPNHANFGTDLAFLVTKLQSESTSNVSSPFYNHINSKSAIMGHSMGGGSSFLAAKNNTTITTMITLAAANTTPSSITAAQYVTVPNLVFSGANDCVAPPSGNQVKMYDSLASACKTHISIKGGAHCEFANSNTNCSFGESTCSPAPTITRTQQQDAVSDFLKLWLEYYLKDNCNSWNIFNDSLAVSTRITHNLSCSVSNPVINQTGSVLNSTTASSYQWYLDGSPINGATSQNYTSTQPGNYYVQATYFNACPYISNSINLTATGVMINSFTKDLKIYPNPATNFVKVDFFTKTDEPVNMRLINIVGQVIFESSMEAKANTTQSHTFLMADLKPGIYFVEVNSIDFKYVEKIIKH